jgi:hypothetical protein
MPPLAIAVALGAGIYAGLKLIGREMRRVGRLLDDQPKPIEAVSFERDPESGVYRLGDKRG